MDTKFWDIFGRSSNQLQSRPYESIEAGKAPIRGTYPVQGNGPSILELYRQGKTPRNRPQRLMDGEDDESALSPRPGSAPNNHGMTASKPVVKVKATQRFKVGLTRSRKSSPDLSKLVNKRASTAGLGSRLYNYNNFDGDAVSKVPSISAFVEAKTNRRKSTYIDLFDAVPTHDVIRERSNGRMDYGEDVADRNIANYGEAPPKSPSRRHSRRGSDASMAHSIVQQTQDSD
jgi:hypothetical protein